MLELLACIRNDKLYIRLRTEKSSNKQSLIICNYIIKVITALALLKLKNMTIDLKSKNIK